jgi:hypothetical protein
MKIFCKRRLIILGDLLVGGKYEDFFCESGLIVQGDLFVGEKY